MFSNHYVIIVLSSLAVYAFILAGLRLTGRKTLSQISVTDLVFVLLISNAVQNAMVGPDTSLWGGLVAAGALFVANFILKELMYHFDGFSKLIQGEDIMLIYNGSVKRRNLERARLTMDELEGAIRDHGICDVKAVNLAVLEVNGSISVLSDDYKNKVVTQRTSRKTSKTSKKTSK